MLDIGFLELLIVAGLALLVLGPDKFPTAIRTGIVWWKRLKNSVESARKQVEDELNYAEMSRQLESYKDSAKKIGEELASVDDIDDFNRNQGKKHATKSANSQAVGKQLGWSQASENAKPAKQPPTGKKNPPGKTNQASKKTGAKKAPGKATTAAAKKPRAKAAN